MTGRDPRHLLEALSAFEWVDLTHAFGPGIPHAPVFPDERRRVLVDHGASEGGGPSGFLAHEYTLCGQWGTHVDPPAHFVAGGRFQDEIAVREMVLPLVVLDVRRAVERDPDYRPTLADLDGWERQYGTVPRGAFVVLHTGWDRRWPDQAAMLNRDREGRRRSPGWSEPVLRRLLRERGVTAIGHDTLDTDPGCELEAGRAELERLVLSADRYQVEALTNLDRVAPVGAIAIATWPKVREGSGFPARVLAITPSTKAVI